MKNRIFPNGAHLMIESTTAQISTPAQDSRTQAMEAFGARITAQFVETMQALVADNTRRLAHYKEDPRLVLEEGIFYANSYYEALKSLSDTVPQAKTNLKHLVKDNSIYLGHFPKDFFHFPKNSAYLAGTQPVFFILNPDKSPAVATEAVKKGVSLIDCGTTCELALALTLLAEFGKEKYDTLFAADSKTLLKFGWSSGKTPLMLFLKPKPTKDLSQVKKGNIVGFGGIELYHEKNPNGEGAQINVTCMSDEPQLFVGLGTDPKGSTPEGITEVLCKEYNRPPVPKEIMPREMARTILKSQPRNEKLENDTKTVEEFKTLGGGACLQVVEIDMMRIFLLAKATLPAARKLMDFWHVQDNPAPKKVLTIPS